MTLNDAINYHKANPEIYQMFCTFTMQAISANRSIYSSKMIVERIRWETMIKAKQGFKISNSMTAFYSRLFILEYPTYYNMFKLKRSAFDGLNFKKLKNDSRRNKQNF